MERQWMEPLAESKMVCDVKSGGEAERRTSVQTPPEDSLPGTLISHV